MSEARFKTMRHIETVRNYLDVAVVDLMFRAQRHDQSKLESPEVEIFEKYTPKLRNCIYDSKEYEENMRGMKVAIDHHNLCNRHHPEHFPGGIQDMNIFDLLEMIIDWRAAGLRHDDGDINKSLEINQKRFGYSDEMKSLLKRTIEYMELNYQIYHKASES